MEPERARLPGIHLPIIYSKEGMSQDLVWYLPMANRKNRTPRRARKASESKFDVDAQHILYSAQIDVAHVASLGIGKAILKWPCSGTRRGQANVTVAG